MIHDECITLTGMRYDFSIFTRENNPKKTNGITLFRNNPYQKSVSLKRKY